MNKILILILILGVAIFLPLFLAFLNIAIGNAPTFAERKEKNCEDLKAEYSWMNVPVKCLKY